MCITAVLPLIFFRDIVDTDRVEREEREAKKKALEDEKAGTTTSGDADAEIPETAVEASGETSAIGGKKKKEVGEGPRYVGPFMYLVYGFELLIGTRKRRPKKSRK